MGRPLTFVNGLHNHQAGRCRWRAGYFDSGIPLAIAVSPWPGRLPGGSAPSRPDTLLLGAILTEQVWPLRGNAEPAGRLNEVIP
jgi:hypothetical protein